jgi:hypothetical protein
MESVLQLGGMKFLGNASIKRFNPPVNDLLRQSKVA